MSSTQPGPARPANRILAHLPHAELQRICPKLQAVPLPVKQVLYKARGPIDYVYFPLRGVVSSVAIMEDGSTIEVATVGNEGMSGLAAFLGNTLSPNEVIVQIEGQAFRMRAEALQEECARDGPLRRMLVRYSAAFSMQLSYAVACNGLHTVEKRCCRWLLMTADRVGSDVLPLTHEFLSVMLGVQRSSVTEVLQPLKEDGLIQSRRGSITIRDRAGLESRSCECYRTVKEEFARLLD